MIQYIPRLIDRSDNAIMLYLWHQGFDTFEIARHLRLKEWQIYAHLPLVRHAADYLRKKG